MTTNDVLNALQKSIESLNPAIGVGNNNYLAGHVAWGAWYGLEMRGYEGGPDTFGPNGIKAKASATMDPRMKTLVISYLTYWYSYGFGPINWFVAGADNYDSQYGTWALTTDMKNLNVPKIEGIDAVRTSPPPPLAVGFLLPAVVNATMFVGHPVPLKDPYLRYLGVNSEFFYIFRSDRAGRYQFTVYTSGSMTARLELSNGNNNGNNQTITTPNTGGDENFQANSPVSFQLVQGINVLRLLVLTERGYNIQKIQVTGPSHL